LGVLFFLLDRVGLVDRLSIRRYNGAIRGRCHFPPNLVCKGMDLYTLLVVARSQSLAKGLRAALNGYEYLIRWAPSTQEALAFDSRPDLLVLDLPPSGGVRCAARLKRRFDVPLLALLHPGLPIPEGVDHALPRQGAVQDLVEMIETLLIDHAPSIVRAGGLSLDRETCRLQINGEIYQLRPIACQILAELLAQAGHTIPRDELFRRVWQMDDGDNTRALDVHISHLRRAIEPDPHNPTLILTERGVGYRLQLHK